MITALVDGVVKEHVDSLHDCLRRKAGLLSLNSPHNVTYSFSLHDMDPADDKCVSCS